MSDAAATASVLAPRGELDLVTTRELTSRLAELAGTPGDAVLDLSEVTFIDSMGLGTVMKAAQRFRRQDKQLVLVVPPDGAVDRLLAITGIGGRLCVAGSRDAALETASRER